jgi:hypothetical protein
MGALPASLLLKVREMDQNILVTGFLLLVLVGGGIKTLISLNDSSFSTNTFSFHQSDINYDFNMVFYCLVIGVIGLFVWLAFSGPDSETNAPAIAQSSSHHLSYVPSNGRLARMVIFGRGVGGSGMIHALPNPSRSIGRR